MNKNLKIACIKKGIKIYEFAKDLEVTLDYISKVIIGIKKLSEEKKESFQDTGRGIRYFI